VTAQHILVPTDFSDYANCALDYAMALAKALPARLTFLHVIQLTPMTMGDMYGYSLEAYLEAMESEAQKHMQALLNRVHQAGLQGETAIVQGVPFQTIVDMAESRDVDLIVMGTHGRTGLTHALMGSVAERVVRMAPCPVLVTRGTTEVSDA
jgi:nucleotide-binding universal stress UspA family protein